MGWRRTLRTAGAIARAVERDARRRARDHARELAALEKTAERDRAAQAVADFQDFLAGLTSFHHTCSPVIDWSARAEEALPAEPQRYTTGEDAARLRLDAYRPSLLSRLLGRSGRERAALATAVDEARHADETGFQSRLIDYRQKVETVTTMRALAARILARDREAMMQYLRTADPFATIAQLGDSLQISLSTETRAVAVLNVHGPEVIPTESARLLASGRVSRRAIPKGEYFRLYQDHVCSAALRVARELLAALPFDSVVVTALDDLVDPATGNLTEQPILSLLAPRPTVARLNFAAVDPSDAMRNFLHRMEFRPTSGFRPIISLDPLVDGAGS